MGCGFLILFAFKEIETKSHKAVYLAEGGKDWHGSIVSTFILHVYTAVERNGTLSMCL